jgi:hypothetical protein
MKPRWRESCEKITDNHWVYLESAPPGVRLEL